MYMYFLSRMAFALISNGYLLHDVDKSERKAGWKHGALLRLELTLTLFPRLRIFARRLTSFTIRENKQFNFDCIYQKFDSPFCQDRNNKPEQQTTTPTMSTNNSTILQSFLTSYSSRLTLSSASKILCLDKQTHDTLTAWSKNNLANIDQPSVTLSSHTSGSTSQWPHQATEYTHIFATLSPDLKTSVKGLKCVHYSLLWKGVAVILPPDGGEVAGEKINMSRLVELGGFEPGKIRTVEVEGGEICFAMRWDLLSA